MVCELPQSLHASQDDARLRLLRALLRRRTLHELVRSHPKLALALHAARARLMLQGTSVATSPMVAKETSVTSDAPAATSPEQGANEQGWDAAVKAACQPPKPHVPVEAETLHQLGVLELLIQHSALLLRLTARMAAAAAAAAAARQPAPGQDSHSSQCAETVCLADDAASQCCRGGRCKRACPEASDDGCESPNAQARKRARHRAGSEPAHDAPDHSSRSPLATRAVQGDARQNKALAGDSHEDSAGSSGEYQASGADASNTEMSESEPSSDYDADLEDDASSCCS